VKRKFVSFTCLENCNSALVPCVHRYSCLSQLSEDSKMWRKQTWELRHKCSWCIVISLCCWWRCWFCAEGSSCRRHLSTAVNTEHWSTLRRQTAIIWAATCEYDVTRSKYVTRTRGRTTASQSSRQGTCSPRVTWLTHYVTWHLSSSSYSPYLRRTVCFKPNTSANFVTTF